MEAEKLSAKNFEASNIIIGFTGSISSGCTLFAKTLAKIAGFHYYSLSAPIHEIANACLKEGYITEINQELLQDIGNELRKENSPHYLAKKILEKIDQDCKPHEEYKVVIDSIRSDWEVKYFKQFPNFFLVSVFSDPEIRFKRWSKVNSNRSRSDFENIDLRDAGELFEYGQTAGP